MQEANLQNSYTGNAEAAELEIVYYTDPLCCWSWAMEPQLRRVQFEYDGKIKWRYCMGGLLPDWKTFRDEVNAVSRPIQMGPVWMHAQAVSGMPMDFNLWMRDPPSSSYPACIAFKSVSLQSGDAATIYLRRLREAVMIRGENISRENILVDIAKTLEDNTDYNFDLGKFKEDMHNDMALEAFRKDINEIQYRNIKRFPTLIIKNGSNAGVIIVGYRTYDALHNSLLHVAPSLKKNDVTMSEENYTSFWGFLTEKELGEIRTNE